MHDANIYRKSFIYPKLKDLCECDEHILGDGAYPISEWMMTPYREVGELSASELNFNYKLSKSRVIIENAFGLLKERFRQLVRLDFHEVDSMAKFVISCCVLHNLCIYAKDPFDETVVELERDEQRNLIGQDEVSREQNGGHNDASAAQQRREKLLGSLKRDSIKDKLFTNVRL